MHILTYSPRAEKDIKKLDRLLQARLKAALERFAKNPFLYAEKLQDRDLGSYRFRLGEYRIIFDVEGNKIMVLRVGHRREIYR